MDNLEIQILQKTRGIDGVTLTYRSNGTIIISKAWECTINVGKKIMHFAPELKGGQKEITQEELLNILEEWE